MLQGNLYEWNRKNSSGPAYRAALPINENGLQTESERVKVRFSSGER